MLKREDTEKQNARTYLPQEAGLLGGRPRADGDAEEGDVARPAPSTAQRSLCAAAARPELRLAEAEGRVEREAERDLHDHRATPR